MDEMTTQHHREGLEEAFRKIAVLIESSKECKADYIGIRIEAVELIEKATLLYWNRSATHRDIAIMSDILARQEEEICND
jgi:hypothetical protein